MKPLLLSFATMLCLASGVQAQTETFVASSAPAPKSSGTVSNSTQKTIKDVIYVTPANQWSVIEMKTSGDMVYFNNLDGLTSLKAFITNSDGNSVMDLKVDAKANGFNCKRLKKGLYFVTLINEATDQKKAFTFTRE